LLTTCFRLFLTPTSKFSEYQKADGTVLRGSFVTPEKKLVVLDSAIVFN